MSAPWTLATIEMATGMPGNSLRYVLDARILPGLRQGAIGESYGRGAPRTFTSFEAFALVLAVRLLGNGIRRATVMSCMDALCAYNPRYPRDVGRTAMFGAFTDRKISSLELAEPGNARFVREGMADRSAWLQAGTGATLSAYNPPVRICVEIGDLRKALDK